MLERIRSLFRRSKENTIDVEELVEKAKEAAVEREEVDDPWKEFKTLCKEIGYDYREVIDKAAWMYLEDTGGIDADDPIASAKEIADVIEKFDDITRKISEPESLRKVREYKEVFKEVGEFKQAVKEFREGKITAKDLIALLGPMLK